MKLRGEYYTHFFVHFSTVQHLVKVVVGVFKGCRRLHIPRRVESFFAAKKDRTNY